MPTIASLPTFAATTRISVSALVCSCSGWRAVFISKTVLTLALLDTCGKKDLYPGTVGMSPKTSSVSHNITQSDFNFCNLEATASSFAPPRERTFQVKILLIAGALAAFGGFAVASRLCQLDLLVLPV